MLTGKKGWLISAGSFVIFVATFSFLISWKLSLVFGLLMLVHELGHYLVCRWKSFSASPPVFIPFFGAFIAIDPAKMNSNDEALVGYGGPFFGSLAAMAIFPVWLFWADCPNVLLLGSLAALWLNFINLIPLRPLDGGRITQVISPWLRYLGLAVVVALILTLPSPIFWLIILVILYAQSENGHIFKCRALLIGAVAMAVSAWINHLPITFWLFVVYAAGICFWQIRHLSKVRAWADLGKKQRRETSALKDEHLKELWRDIDLNRSFMTKEQLEAAESLALKVEAEWEALEIRINEDLTLADNFLHGVKKPLPSVRKRIAWTCCYLVTAITLAAFIAAELMYAAKLSWE